MVRMMGLVDGEPPRPGDEGMRDKLKQLAARPRLIGESIQPVKSLFALEVMARGEPGMPGAFTWRGKRYVTEAVLETWKETGDCTHGANEKYVRKHWFRVRLEGGAIVKLYFLRNANQRMQQGSGWWLYTITEAAPE